MKRQKIKWLTNPEIHDYPAATSYLSLIFDVSEAEKITNELMNTKIVEYKAKDIFRASKLALLGVSNSHVNKNIKKIKMNSKMSPILLVRDSTNGQVIVADGYHRLCAVYTFNEDAIIPCKII